jgi:hypothetical protein
MVSKEIAKLDLAHQEALKLLSQYGSMTDLLVLQRVQDKGIKASYQMFPRVQRETGLVYPVSGQPPTNRPEYELRWEINPQLHPAIRKYFEQNLNSKKSETN